MAAAYRIMEMPILPPSTLRKDVPPELDAIVMRALARDASLRYPSADDMALALDGMVRESGFRRQDLAEFIAACAPVRPTLTGP